MRGRRASNGRLPGASSAGLPPAAPSTPPLDQHVEATHYKQHARGGYAPPGTPDDPWGPYILESSAKFDVPERWIREVMRVEVGRAGIR